MTTLTEDIQIDDANDVVTVCGIKYAGEMFRDLAGVGGALQVGMPFVIRARADSTLHIERLEDFSLHA